MERRRSFSLAVALLALAGCERNLSKPKPDAVLIELAPDVVSSEDGSLLARATVVEGNTPLRGRSVRMQIAFTDQLGNVRAVPGITGDTDDTGALEHRFAGLDWAGAGTITAEVLDGDGEPYTRGDVPVASTATFSVVDLTPPEVTIVPPTESLPVGRNLPLDIEVDFTDLMGVSRVTIQAVGEMNSTQSRIVASGSSSGSVVFEFDVPGAAVPGPTITLYALAEDLSGNIAAAAPLVLTVDPNILVAVPPGFGATQVAAGNGTFLTNPRSIAFSAKDEMLYIADNSGGACGRRCVWKVNPATGAASVLTTGIGTMEGVAFDATADHIYFTDRQNQILRMTWSAGNMQYESPLLCHDTNGPPQDPFHLIVDGTTVLVAEQNNQTLMTLDVTDCLGTGVDTTQPADLSDQLDTPWGVAQIPAGDYLMSDEQQDAIFRVQADGTTSLYEGSRLDQPRGIAWVEGTSTFADSLLIASFNDQRVYSSQGNNSSRTAVSLVHDPVDVAVGSGTWEGTVFVLADGGAGYVFAIDGYQ